MEEMSQVIKETLPFKVMLKDSRCHQATSKEVERFSLHWSSWQPMSLQSEFLQGAEPQWDVSQMTVGRQRVFIAAEGRVHYLSFQTSTLEAKVSDSSYLICIWAYHFHVTVSQTGWNNRPPCYQPVVVRADICQLVRGNRPPCWQPALGKLPLMWKDKVQNGISVVEA